MAVPSNRPSSNDTLPSDAITDRQQEAIASTVGALLVTGAPGTGGSTVLVRRAVRFAEQGGGDVLLVVTTPAAARDLTSRLQALDAEGRVHVTTTAVLAATGLRRHGAQFGGRSFTIYRDGTARTQVAAALRDHGYKDLGESPYEVWRAIMVRKHRNEAPGSVSPSFPLDADGFRTVFDAYQARLNRARALDAADVIQHAASLASDGDVQHGMPDRWQHVLVDDLQNITWAEIQVLRQIAAGAETLTAAMHPDHGIRDSLGADPDPAASFFDGRSGVERIELTIPDLPPPIQHATSAIAFPAGADTDLAIDAELDSDSHEDTVHVVQAPSAEAEAQVIRQRIEHLRRREATGRIAVLAETSAVRNAIDEELRTHDIPVHGPHDPYRDRAALRDLLAYLQVAANPHADAPLLRIANEPSRGIGRKTKQRIQAYAAEHDLSVWEAIAEAREAKALSSRARRVLGAFREMMAPVVEDADTQSPQSLVRSILDATGYLRTVTRSRTREQLEREEQVERFIASLPDTPGRNALHAYLDRASLGRTPEPAPDAVVVASIRAVDGAAFDAFFIAGLEEGRLPREAARQREARLQEERRLLVAGCTRARRELVLTWAESRGTGRQTEPTTRSRFLDDLERRTSSDAAVVFSVGIPDAWTSAEDRTAAGGSAYRESLRTRASNRTATRTPTDEDIARIEVGQRVSHPKMGVGTVRDVDIDGEERTAVVAFDERGTKKVNLRYAPLEILPDS